MKIVIPEDAVVAEVWITRFALRTGIVKTEASLLPNGTAAITRVKPDGKIVIEQFTKNEWHRTFEQALAAAEKMKKVRTGRLQRQLKKLESLVFLKMEG